MQTGALHSTNTVDLIKHHTDAPSKSSPLPRDGDIAVQEEFDAAIATDGTAGLILFIQRHPDHDLADQAKAKMLKHNNE